MKEEEGERGLRVRDGGYGRGLRVRVAEGRGGAEGVVDLVAEFGGEGEEGWGGVGHLLVAAMGQLVGEVEDLMRLVGDGFLVGVESDLKTSNSVSCDSGFASMKLDLAGCQMDPRGAGRLLGVCSSRWEDW